MRLFQKGQSMVEFAVTFPFFLFIVLAVAYFSFAFADYLQLTYIARDSAREAAIVSVASKDRNNNTRSEKDKQKEREGKYQAICNKYRNKVLISDVYTMGNFSITSKDDDVLVKINAPLNEHSVLGNTINTLLNFFAKENENDNNKVKAFDINIQYKMYNEKNVDKS
ncbi:TadE-like protein [Selenomonas sp. WCT3]|uniref:TadE family protein n=1 Tax=Selenomonas sp. WCT3 TaxID=3158785 RepID=UPI0008811287|nr:TadE-like protein [Selenomonas ruminantium]